MTTESNVVSERDKAYFDVFVTALEGGIGYWSVCKKYHWRNPDDTVDYAGYYAVVSDEDEPYDEEPQDWRIDRATIAKGVTRFYEWAVEHGTSDYNLQAAVRLKHGKWDRLDFDAETADIIIQLALFGELMYG